MKYLPHFLGKNFQSINSASALACISSDISAYANLFWVKSDEFDTILGDGMCIMLFLTQSLNCF